MAVTEPPPSLREQNRRQAEQRIVDAAIELVEAEGRITFTMPQVADRSGVALRTLYRHFPTRGDLVERLAAVADQVDAIPPPETLEGLEEWMVAAWANLRAIEPFLRAQHEGPAGDAMRRKRIPRHRVVTAGLIDQIRPDLDTATRDDLVDQAMLLSSSTAMFELTDVIGADPDRAARLAARAIITLVRSA